MKKAWRTVIIVCLIIIAVEAAGAAIFLRPYYQVQRVFDKIEDGQWQRTQECYEKLNDKYKERVQSCLDDFSADLCRRYIDGELAYDRIVASFDAINSIDAGGTLMDKYLSQVSRHEYKADIDAIYTAGLNYDNSTVYEMNNNIRLVQQRMSNEDRECALIEMLNEKYQLFLDEQISDSQLQFFASLVQGLSTYDAYAYTPVISNNISCVMIYREAYNEAQRRFDSEDYFRAIALCRAAVLDTNDTVYRERFDSLHQQAYEMGKLYYGNQLDSYIDAQEKSKAVELMDSITLCYGADFDLTGYKERMAEDWQLAYIACLNNLEASLENELRSFETGQYILEHEYDNLKPDSMVLHDIDGNGVPEMFLYNSAHKEDDYIGSFIYTCVNGRCQFVDFVNVKSFCNGSYLIGFPIAFTRNEGDECSLVQFDGSSLTQLSYCQEIGETYYVNGAEVSDVDYLSERTYILSFADAYNVGNSKGADMEGAEGFILAY